MNKCYKSRLAGIPLEDRDAAPAHLPRADSLQPADGPLRSRRWTTSVSAERHPGSVEANNAQRRAVVLDVQWTDAHLGKPGGGQCPAHRRDEVVGAPEAAPSAPQQRGPRDSGGTRPRPRPSFTRVHSASRTARIEPSSDASPPKPTSPFGLCAGPASRNVLRREFWPFRGPTTRAPASRRGFPTGRVGLSHLRPANGATGRSA